jgi:hypothetical protein
MVVVKTAVLGYTTSPTLEVRYRNLGGRCCSNLQGRTVGHEWKKLDEYREIKGLEV